MTEINQPTSPRQQVVGDYKTLLNRNDIAQFLEKSDVSALWMLLVNWLIIAFAFALPIYSTNVLTILISLVLLGNRQLGLGILMHDCSHSALFKTRHYNQIIGKWLCAAPILADLDGYRKYHLKHHKEAGTTNDPDYPNYKGYPVKKDSFIRKCIRDFTGLTGLKTVITVLYMHMGVFDYDMSYQKSEKHRISLAEKVKNLSFALFPSLVIHLIIVSVLWVFSATEFYLLWWAAFLTTNMFFSRIRNSAEHANVPDLLDTDPRLHARTTIASWWEKLTFAPNHVNFHLEHHWQPTVPPYRLESFHNYLMDKGYLQNAEVLTGYSNVMRRMMNLKIV